MGTQPRVRITLQHIADAAGVSVATVSYVLSGRKDRANGPPAETRERVQTAAVELGYRANTSARTLRRQRTELIALVYRPPAGPWLDRLIVQAEDLAEARGYSLICVPIVRDGNVEQSLRAILRGYVDGVILAGGPLPGVMPERLAEATRGVIVFDEERDPARGIDVVRSEERRALREVTAYLISDGRRRIAYLAHREPVGQRRAGFLDAMTEAGIAVDDSLLIHGADDTAAAIASVEGLLGRGAAPDAIICESDRGGLAAVQVARSHGLAVPGDLAVIGIGNTTYAEISDPPLTSVGMPALDFGPVIETLFERIEDPDAPGRVLTLPWRVNRRASA
jgi:LacI family transcriptional regulator